MDMENLEVFLVTKKDLSTQLKASVKERKYPLPFSENKAYWLLEKPGMDDEDYCAVLATANNEILSFTHLVPDTLSRVENSLDPKDRKIYWMPQWYASKSAKSTVISTYVFSEALKATKYRVLTKAYEENAEDFYTKQPFSVLQTTQRHMIFIGLSSGGLIRKFSFLKHFKPLTNKLEGVSRSFYSRLNRKKVNALSQNISIKYIHRLDTDCWDFVAPFVENDLIEKSKEYINWHIDSRQYLSNPWNKRRTGPEIIKGYGSKVGIINYMVEQDNDFIGFVSFHYIGQTVYMKYCIADPKDMPRVCATVYKHLSLLGITYLYTDNQLMTKHFVEIFSIVYHYTQTKKAMAHNTLFPVVQNAEITEQDGHFI